MYNRIINLIGNDNFAKLANCKILLVGIGGVGSFAFECLIRSGFNDITVYDGDVIEDSNMNRQLVANLSTIGMYKGDVAKKRAENINEKIKIQIFNEYLNEEKINKLNIDFNYIIDACDDVLVKVSLYKFAEKNNIKIISAMGVGNRVDASKIKISRLDKTSNDPLAKKLRKLVKDNQIKMKIPVVCSDEIPIKKGEVNSMITSPSIAGILMVDYIINDLILY